MIYVVDIDKLLRRDKTCIIRTNLLEDSSKCNLASYRHGYCMISDSKYIDEFIHEFMKIIHSSSYEIIH